MRLKNFAVIICLLKERDEKEELGVLLVQFTSKDLSVRTAEETKQEERTLLPAKDAWELKLTTRC